MGLAISVYQNVRETTNQDEADFIAYVIDNEWLHKIKNLNNNAHYVGECVDREINYPYSYHNRFREQLLRVIDRSDLLDKDGHIKWDELPADSPFVDLIDFADNEGCLDFEVSEKLYQDFTNFEEDAEQVLTPYYLETYKQWLNAFNLGRQNGVVVFR